MQPILGSAIEEFIEISEDADIKLTSRKATTEELKMLESELPVKLPQWYRDLIGDYPIINLEVKWNVETTNPSYSGETAIEFFEPQYIIEETMEEFPGIDLVHLNYICIGSEPAGTGDNYYIRLDDEDPTLYQFPIPIGSDETEPLLERRIQIAEHISDVFREAIKTIQ
ncbi:SMI1/KNR4 family protein [Brochothrix thermosphacta]|uniref:SMI1/KNR4 family protein n=1 Tax=Brochothrix thermosphacta TaxID=2756 RepID=UPI00083F726E|nr:SMI1/KNR4 family protein [Brochothrix thermosphacta]ODJ64868.1 hypothetical protein BFR37_02415 [Brochothrix thermosphacta]ODJ67844.1 hypothetical protein BFR35_04615 [Brochothrix thermosphacta]SPN72171.1 protein of unknown function [Brochothrix thermosphacta]